MHATMQTVKRSDAVRVEDGYWRSGWLAVLWDGEQYGFADVRVTAGLGAEITFTVFSPNGLKPVYRIDVDHAGRELTIWKNFDGRFNEVGAISYDDDGNAIDKDGAVVDVENVDPFQVDNVIFASEEHAAQIAELMVKAPFAAEELFTRAMAVVGDLTGCSQSWARRHLRKVAAPHEPEWTNLWRPIDIGPDADSFPMKDADPGPVVWQVDVANWQGYHLIEEDVSALLDDRGQRRPRPFSVDRLTGSYVGKEISIDDVPHAVQLEWIRIWKSARIVYKPN